MALPLAIAAAAALAAADELGLPARVLGRPSIAVLHRATLRLPAAGGGGGSASQSDEGAALCAGAKLAFGVPAGACGSALDKIEAGSTAIQKSAVGGKVLEGAAKAVDTVRGAIGAVGGWFS